MSPLSSVAATRQVLEDHGLAAKHSLGQNFLVNDGILRKIIDLAAVTDEDVVLEVGPGLGTLTIPLLKNAARVVSVERDPDLPAVLGQTLDPWKENFALIHKDALDLTIADLEGAGCAPTFPGGSPSKLVANLPYAVAATVVLAYFQRFPSIDSATVMVQREVADRMAAQPGSKNYGAYTVKLGMYAQPAGRFAVGPGNFFPPPRVESAVLRLDRRLPVDDAGIPLTPEVVAASCAMADAAFASRRKTLANSARTAFASRGVDAGAAAEALRQVFEEAGIDPRRRGETLDQAEFIRLGQALIRCGGPLWDPVAGAPGGASAPDPAPAASASAPAGGADSAGE